MPIPSSMHEMWEGAVLPTLTEYTRIECLSPAFDPDWAAHGALQRAAELLAGWAGDQGVPGLRAEVVAPPGLTPVVLADAPPTGPGAGSAPTVLVYGHLDKQPPQGEWLAGLGPYTPVRRDERLYGRGTADDGYALFAAVTALGALAASGADRPRVVVLIEASEESGSPDLVAHLDALADRIGRPDLVVCLDSGCLTYDRLWLTTSLRGNLVAEVTARVLTEGVHSGLAGGVVPSSFRVLRQLLSRVEDPATGEILVDELRAHIPDAHRKAAAEVARQFPAAVSGELPVVDGVALAGDDEADRLLRRSWYPALAVTGVGGIPVLPDGGNVLRPYTSLRLSLRLPPDVDPKAAEAALVRTLTSDPPQGASVSVTAEAAAGWVAPEPPPWVTAALEQASLACFGHPPGAYGEGGTIPFLAELGHRFPGVPLVATGVLGPHSNAHGPNEFLHLPMAEAVSTALAHLLEAATASGGPAPAAAGRGQEGGADRPVR